MTESRQSSGYLVAERTESCQSPGYLGAKMTESRQSRGYLGDKRTESRQSTGYPWRGLDLDWTGTTCTLCLSAYIYLVHCMYIPSGDL